MAVTLVVVAHPVLCVAVSCADDTTGFLDHLEDSAAVDGAHDVGVIRPHDPAVKKKVHYQ